MNMIELKTTKFESQTQISLKFEIVRTCSFAQEEIKTLAIRPGTCANLPERHNPENTVL